MSVALRGVTLVCAGADLGLAGLKKMSFERPGASVFSAVGSRGATALAEAQADLLSIKPVVQNRVSVIARLRAAMMMDFDAFILNLLF
jgi:hypothetical protein